MTLYIPDDIVNIIFEYYAQMHDLRWAPFIDVKTGKTKKRVNKYSTKYNNINKLLEHRSKNLVHAINIDVDITRYGETIDSYSTIGTSICLKSKYLNNSRFQSLTLYVEFIDKYNFKNYAFYSITLFTLIPGISMIDRVEYYNYQDGNIHSTINCEIFDKTHYSLVLEKF